MTHWFVGEYEKARDHLERALALFRPARDDDLAIRFGHDAGVAAMLHLAFTLWPLGEVERAVSLVAAAQERIAGLSYKNAYAMGKMHAAMFGLARGILPQTASDAAELARISHDHDLNFWRAYGVCLEGWVKTMSSPAEGLADMESGLELLREHNPVLFVPLLKRAVAKAIARRRRPDEFRDGYLAKFGQPPQRHPVMVRPWDVCMTGDSPSRDAWEIKTPSRSQLNSAARAMRSFVRKFPQYGLISGVGRGRLALYERGDDLSAMWARLNRQSRSLVAMNAAEAALRRLSARRNEPFVVHEKRQLDFVILSTGKRETRRRKRIYRDASLPVEAAQ